MKHSICIIMIAIQTFNVTYNFLNINSYHPNTYYYIK